MTAAVEGNLQCQTFLLQGQRQVVPADLIADRHLLQEEDFPGQRQQLQSTTGGEHTESG